MQNFDKNKLFGIILAGGSGSRLWPLSREMYPKQLLKFNGENTLFQSTFLRLSEIIPDENILTVTNIKHSGDIRLQLKDIARKAGSNKTYKDLTEPVGRNTAPAIALAAFYVLNNIVNDGTDPILLVTPSDHLINNTNEFNRVIKEGIVLAEKGFIVTFGIKPDKPDTGYGYIKTQRVEEIAVVSSEGLKVSEFKEKPDYETAKMYVESGNYFWNGGIFMFKASTMLNELQKFVPEIFEQLKNTKLNETAPTVSFEDYEKLTDISIDYAVMEKSDLIALLPLDCDWNDLGSWEAIFETSKKDENNNYIAGNAIDIGSKNSMIYSTSKVVTTIGLENTVVIETPDAILVCNKDKTQDVKKIFEKLKFDNNLACICHRTVYRPWGYYTVLQREDDFLTRTIHVNSASRIKLQKHNNRSEHWVILSGKAGVIRNQEYIYLNPGDSIDIPVGTAHSLENLLDTELKVLEVQKGEYLSEDDVIHLEESTTV